MHDPKCERCGAPAPDVGPSIRTVCPRCATRAGDRTSALDLHELTGRGDDRVSLELVGSENPNLAAPVIVPRRSFRPVVWLGIGVLLGALSFGGSSAVVEHATALRSGPPRAAHLDARAPRDERTEKIAPAGPRRAAREAIPTEEREAEPPAEPASSATLPAATEPVAPASTSRPRTRPTPLFRTSRSDTPRSDSNRSDGPRSDSPRDGATLPIHDETTSARGVPAPADPLSPLPSRSAVRAAFLRVGDDAQQCGDIEHIGSVVTAQVHFDGASGRVTHARVTDASVPPEVRSCIARVARGARVEPFARESFTVLYPFRL